MFRRSSSILWFSNKKGGCSPEKHCTLSRCSGTTLILSLLVICLLGGCGYRFSPAGEHIDKNIRKVFVDIFANRTSEANVESTFRNAFIDQFITGRRFIIVDSREAADAILKGSIESLTTSPLSYKSSNIAAEERITVTMELSFEEKVSSAVIWMNKSFTGTQDYPVADMGAKEASRKNALTKLANDTAERAYNSMMSGF
ncbi:MAG: hypothetical protein FJ139_09470 [Deltaproteobacteria bacterium]|nr:hypothetical protein [Deltaproteobacteria bacterium]